MTDALPIADIISLLERSRLPLSDEKQLQADMAAVLRSNGFVFQREVRLSKRDIVDFLSDAGLAIEVKIGGGCRAIYRQIERYCAHDAVRGILLATNVAMSLPPQINGKPTAIANLGRGWL